MIERRSGQILLRRYQRKIFFCCCCCCCCCCWSSIFSSTSSLLSAWYPISSVEGYLATISRPTHKRTLSSFSGYHDAIHQYTSLASPFNRLLCSFSSTSTTITTTASSISSEIELEATPISTATMNPKLLGEAWTSHIVESEKSIQAQQTPSQIQRAIERTLPLFTTDTTSTVSSVPFICRYRTDVIYPMTTQQVHTLQSLVTKHTALEQMREKVLPHFKSSSNKEIKYRILTTTSKTELEDIYAPYKPQPKGSIVERIQQEYPKLFEFVDNMWISQWDAEQATAKCNNWWQDHNRLGPKDAMISLLGTKLASEPEITWLVLKELQKYCRIQTIIVKDADTKKKKETTHKTKQKPTPTSYNKYQEAYHDFNARLMSLKDHQVLAIRRGINEKLLKMTYEIDSEKMEKYLMYQIRHQESIVPQALLLHQHTLLKESIHDAWTRLLRRRCTTRLWNDKCIEAQNRASQVFEDNLRRALLEPPYCIPTKPILALDPGFAAGIKCAILDANGNVQKLITTQFVGNEKRKQQAIHQFMELLEETKQLQQQKEKQPNKTIIVALGNGHGSQECRGLIQEASASSGIPIDMQLVNEAGASVWSVTVTAQTEFPNHPPASIAAISIGRRLQNPLFELVKVPPKSLGLGMYQHDLSDKELDDKLEFVSVDAVATVGVNVNTCNLEILQKVPGITKGLAQKIIKSRPLKRRTDLLQISGLGPKTFENCAGFVRIENGPDALDDTLVHPESYELARWLLKTFAWQLDQGKPSNIPERNDWNDVWKDRIVKAADKFQVSEERVLAVIENLIDSMSKEDPRLKSKADGGSSTSSSVTTGIIENCRHLPKEMSEMFKLEKAAAKGPIRGIVGTIRNVADFGAFIDIGAENDGLLHISKLGPSLHLSNLLIGQQVGVDILSVAKERISLGLHGCNLEPSQSRSTSHHAIRGSNNKGGSNGKKRALSTIADGRQKKQKTAKRRK